MQVNAIIAEYNPFHKGHSFQLRHSRAETGADYTVIVLGGNFMQRGIPAISDKYSRARMALLGGADLVLELPVLYAAGSAEYFAIGAVSLLDRLGVVDTLSFGSECGDVSLLAPIAEALCHESPLYQTVLQRTLKEGLPYPLARAKALSESGRLSPDQSALLHSPNNILGIEYIKALLYRGSSIEPRTVARQGAAYSDTRLHPAKLSSATAIRGAIFRDASLSLMEDHLPADSRRILRRLWAGHSPVHPNDLSLPLICRLWELEDQDLSVFWDVSPMLSDRIKKEQASFVNYEDFCQRLKTRDQTYSRISRGLLHILLNIRQEHIKKAASLDYAPYARILGFRKSAAPLLHEIKERADLTIISKVSRGLDLLPEQARFMLRQDLFASKLYNSLLAVKSGIPVPHEYATPIVMI